MKGIAAAFCVLMIAFSVNSFAEEEKAMQLQEVVVTATKTEKDPKDVTQTVTVITADELKKSGATTAGEAVGNAVGSFVFSYGPRGALNAVSIRGSQYSQTLILMDGVRLNSPMDGGFDLSSLPVALGEIERIEILRGPSSALYGADAVSGVVNIITKKPGKARLMLADTMGSNGYDETSLGFSGKHGALSYALTASKDAYDGYRANSDLDQASGSGGVGYAFSDETALDLSTKFIGMESGVPGPTNMPSLLARQKKRLSVSDMKFKTKLHEDIELKLSASYSTDVLKYKDPDWMIDSRHETISRATELQVNWRPLSWHALTAGYEARRDHLDSTDTGIHSALLTAFYLQDEIKVNEPIIIVVGGRADSHSAYGSQFSPRISGRYMASNAGTIIRASAGRSFKAPSFNDLYWKDQWSEGNIDLKPEIAFEYEAGVEQGVGRLGAIKITGFRRRVKDMILWKYDVFPMHPENIGKASIRGAEAEIDLKPSERFAWTLSYTYIDPLDELNDKIIYGTPQNQIKSSMNIGLPAGLNINLEGRMVNNYNKPGEDVWQYSVLDGKISRTLDVDACLKGEIYLGVKNAFDRKYALARSYDFMTGAHSGDYPMPPREIYGGVSVQF